MQSLFISSSKKSSGKTILSIGLAALAHQEKLNTQTFKKGPDFIDPSWLNAASNNPCYNLDFNTMSRDEIKDLYNSKSKNSDFTVIEGTKGLFDGVAIDGSDSNAALAKIIKTEVVLIIDCQGITRGIAPLLNGYRSFDKQLNLTKVILNNVSNTRHEDKLICSIKEYTDFKCYGAIPKINDIIDERHLGLVPAFQHDNRKKILATLRNNLKSCIEYKKLIPAPKKNKFLINNKIDDKTILPSKTTNFLKLKKNGINNKISNSPLAISLSATKELKAKNVYLIGFDGYDKNDKINDYSLFKENQKIFDFYKNKLNLMFLTDTIYENINKSSIYKYLS